MNAPTTCAARVLVVDDDPDLLDLIAMRLGSAGYEVMLAASGEEALAAFRTERPRVVITDLRMDGMDGHALFEKLYAEAASVPVIILTAHGTIPDAVAATQRGVFGFLTKPFDGRELLARVAEALMLSPPVAIDQSEAAWRRQILGNSTTMDELFRAAKRQIDVRTPLLIEGDRGSGKELLAAAIHEASTGARKPFCILRCGSDDELSETKRFATLLDQARGGTLFLDDVEQLSPAVQVRLLPLVGDLGLFAPQKNDVRIVATTSQVLDNAIRDGSLRTDLYYALSRNTLCIPGLSERREDIPLLVCHFTAAWLRASGVAGRGLSPEALGLLCEAAWPGNVRQLRSIVEQALAQTVGPVVPAKLVKRLLQEENAREMAAFDEARRGFEYDYLSSLLSSTAGNVSQAARIAQRNRTEFYKLLARHNLDPASFKSCRN